MRLDLSKFAKSIPYASERFGIYQPLLGWKSRRIRQRFSSGLSSGQYAVLNSLLARLRADASVRVTDFNAQDVFFKIEKLNPALPKKTTEAVAPMLPRAYVFDVAAKIINEHALKPDDEGTWKAVGSDAALAENLKSVAALIQQNHQQIIKDTLGLNDFRSGIANVSQNADRVKAVLADRVMQESLAAGLLKQLLEAKRFDLLKQMFFPQVLTRPISLSSIS